PAGQRRGAVTGPAREGGAEDGRNAGPLPHLPERVPEVPNDLVHRISPPPVVVSARPSPAPRARPPPSSHALPPCRARDVPRGPEPEPAARERLGSALLQVLEHPDHLLLVPVPDGLREDAEQPPVGRGAARAGTHPPAPPPRSARALPTTDSSRSVSASSAARPTGVNA